jgi:hypothetical protein
MKNICIFLKNKEINEKLKKSPSSNAILVFIPQPPILEMVPQMLFCSCLIKGEE